MKEILIETFRKNNDQKYLLILLFFSCVFTKNAKAQSTLCPAINALEGEWRYANGQDTIKVYLRTKDYTILDNGTATIAKIGDGMNINAVIQLSKAIMQIDL